MYRQDLIWILDQYDKKDIVWLEVRDLKDPLCAEVKDIELLGGGLVRVRSKFWGHVSDNYLYNGDIVCVRKYVDKEK